MNTWTSSGDAFVRIGKAWVRQSSVVIVEPTHEDGARVHLDNGKTISINMSPDKVIDALVGRVRQ